MKIELEIAEVIVISSNQMKQDRIILKTKLPSPFVETTFPPDLLPLELIFHATRHTGVDYVKKHFGIDPVILRQL